MEQHLLTMEQPLGSKDAKRSSTSLKELVKETTMEIPTQVPGICDGRSHTKVAAARRSNQSSGVPPGHDIRCSSREGSQLSCDVLPPNAIAIQMIAEPTNNSDDDPKHTDNPNNDSWSSSNASQPQALDAAASSYGTSSLVN